MDDHLRELERGAALDPSLEGQLLKAQVRSGQLDGDRLYVAALLYHRGARDALGWPADAPITQVQTSADGATHALHTVHLGPKLDRVRKVGASRLEPLCGAVAADSAPTVHLVTCAECLRLWVADDAVVQVSTATYAAQLVNIPGELHVAIRSAWIVERALFAHEGRADAWSSHFEAVSTWLAAPSPTHLAEVTAALDALDEDDHRLTCACFAANGARGNEWLLSELLGRMETAVLRGVLAPLGAWAVGRGPDPVTA